MLLLGVTLRGLKCTESALLLKVVPILQAFQVCPNIALAVALSGGESLTTIYRWIGLGMVHPLRGE